MILVYRQAGRLFVRDDGGAIADLSAVENAIRFAAIRQCAELARRRADEENRNEAYGALDGIASELEEMAAKELA